MEEENIDKLIRQIKENVFELELYYNHGDRTPTEQKRIEKLLTRANAALAKFWEGGK